MSVLTQNFKEIFLSHEFLFKSSTLKYQIHASRLSSISLFSITEETSLLPPNWTYQIAQRMTRVEIAIISVALSTAEPSNSEEL